MSNPANEANPANQAPIPPEGQEAPAEGQGDTVKLVVADSWCTEFNAGDGKGGILTVTREGTDVPRDFAKDLIETAAKHGVSLQEVSE